MENEYIYSWYNEGYVVYKIISRAEKFVNIKYMGFMYILYSEVGYKQYVYTTVSDPYFDLRNKNINDIYGE